MTTLNRRRTDRSVWANNMVGMLAFALALLTTYFAAAREVAVLTARTSQVESVLSSKADRVWLETLQLEWQRRDDRINTRLDLLDRKIDRLLVKTSQVED